MAENTRPACMAAPEGSAAENPAPWQDYQTVFTNAKAGMDGVDKEHVQRVVYEMSKDSAHFRNEQRKAAAVEARVAKLRERSAALTPAELAAAARSVDARIAALESRRDLSRTWLHADMDCFYAAVHELERPELKQLPMAVGGIGMISTANYVARRFGVRSAMPGFIAKRLCPQLVFVPLDFPRYTAAAERVRAVFAQFDPDYESGGLDEAYLDITDFCAAHGCSGEQAATELRRRVREATGLTCSAGVASNRMLAKICSDINKPNGQYVLPPSRAAILSFMDTLPARKIPCIGRVTESVLRGVLGVSTCGQLLGPQRPRLPLLFSEAAAGFYLEAALGIAGTRHPPKVDTSLEPGRKGISCERTFRAMRDAAQQEAMARQLVESLASDMAAEGLEGRNITLKLKLSTFEVRSRALTLPRHVRTPADMLAPVLRLLRAEMPVELRLMGVRMAALRKVNSAVSSPLARLLGLRRQQPDSAGAVQQQHPHHQHEQPGSEPPAWQGGAQGQQTAAARPGSVPDARAGGSSGGSAAAAALRTTEPGASPAPRHWAPPRAATATAAAAAGPLPPWEEAVAAADAAATLRLPLHHHDESGNGTRSRSPMTPRGGHVAGVGAANANEPAEGAELDSDPEIGDEEDGADTWRDGRDVNGREGFGQAYVDGPYGLDAQADEGDALFDEEEEPYACGDAWVAPAMQQQRRHRPVQPQHDHARPQQAQDPQQPGPHGQYDGVHAQGPSRRGTVQEGGEQGGSEDGDEEDVVLVDDGGAEATGPMHTDPHGRRQHAQGIPGPRQVVRVGTAVGTGLHVHATGPPARAALDHAPAGVASSDVEGGRTAAAHGGSEGAAAGAGAGSGRCGVGGAGSVWTCRVCTYARNRRQLLRCEVCDCLRGSTQPPPSLPVAGTAAAASKPAQPPRGRSSVDGRCHQQQQNPQQQQQRKRPLDQLWAAATAGQGSAGVARISGTAGQQQGGAQETRSCPQCGAMVHAAEWGEHQDWHLALRLSREGMT